MILNCYKFIWVIIYSRILKQYNIDKHILKQIIVYILFRRNDSAINKILR